MTADAFQRGGLRPARAGTYSSGETWRGFNVQRKPLAWLKPCQQNARIHDDQIEKLRTLVLAREDGTIIAGHCHVEAAKLEGLAEMPVIIASGWSDEQCMVYTIQRELTELQDEIAKQRDENAGLRSQLKH